MDVSENGHTPKIIQLNRIFFMRPTLGNYFEVEPGSGISVFNNFHFLDNFYTKINQQESQQHIFLVT